MDLRVRVPSLAANILVIMPPGICPTAKLILQHVTNAEANVKDIEFMSCFRESQAMASNADISRRKAERRAQKLDKEVTQLQAQLADHQRYDPDHQSSATYDRQISNYLIAYQLSHCLNVYMWPR